MANKAISELPQALNVNNQDLFVLEQSGIAKKLTAETFITEQGIIDALAEALDGHGGISSVTLSSVSGRIRTYLITFTDETTTTFQVLDGTSISRIEKTSSAGLVDTYTIFMNDGTTSFFQVRNGQDGSATWDQINGKAPAITDTASGAIAIFLDGAEDIPVTSLVANIEPVQDLSNGDPSPSNVCPITGWTGCNVTRTGKNLLSVQPTLQTNQAQMIADLGRNTTGETFTITFDFDNVDYQTGSSALIDFREEDGTHHYLTPSNFSNGQNTLANATKPASGRYSYTGSYTFRYVYCYFMSSSYGKWTGAINNAQLELGSSATAYEAPQVQTVTVDWTTEAGTVYGGSIDVATGLLTVEKTSQTITGNDLNLALNIQPEGNLWRLTFATSRPHPTSSYSDALCNSYKVVKSYSAVNNTNNSVALNNSAMEQILARNDSFTTRQEIIDGLNASPIQLVYELATPQTYQLTPQEVKTLLGTNNVWANTGNVSVTYTADTKLYIQNLTQPTEDDLVANQAITSGKYFMIGNSLYLALANIANGAQITIGTNAQRVSLADALNTINS